MWRVHQCLIHPRRELLADVSRVGDELCHQQNREPRLRVDAVHRSVCPEAGEIPSGGSQEPGLAYGGGDFLRIWITSHNIRYVN